MSFYEEFIAQCDNLNIVAEGFELKKITSENSSIEEKFGTFHIIFKIFENAHLKNLPNLVVLPGFSLKSFCGSTNVIFNNLEYIMNHFSSLYIICYDDAKIKSLQKTACTIRDKFLEDKSITLYDISDQSKYTEAYMPEIAMNENIAICIDKILRSPVINLSNVHLLGKSASGGVAIHTIDKSDIYTGLYLTVPSSPLDVKYLLDIDEKRLYHITKIKYRFAWSNDVYKFTWFSKYNMQFEDKELHLSSRDEYTRYENTMHQFNLKNGGMVDYKLARFDNSFGHEIPNQLFSKFLE